MLPVLVPSLDDDPADNDPAADDPAADDPATQITPCQWLLQGSLKLAGNLQTDADPCIELVFQCQWRPFVELYNDSRARSSCDEMLHDRDVVANAAAVAVVAAADDDDDINTDDDDDDINTDDDDDATTPLDRVAIYITKKISRRNVLLTSVLTSVLFIL